MIKKNEKRTPTSINLLTGSTYDLNVLSWSESNTVGKKNYHAITYIWDNQEQQLHIISLH